MFLIAACSYREIHNFFIQSSPQYKPYLFTVLSNACMVDIEYLQEICSPIFVVEDYSGMFARLSII